MKVLVVYAHPNPASFNHAVLTSFQRGLDEAGHVVDVVDLYDIGFDPCFRNEDFAQFTGGTMPADVREQQAKVDWADALVFISPIWWMGFPAILKGWGERVFSSGYAYRLTPEGWQGHTRGRVGLLSHRKVLIMTTTFFSEKDYEATGLKDAIEKTMVEWAFQGSGETDIRHVYFYGVYWVGEAERKNYLNTAYELGKTF